MSRIPESFQKEFNRVALVAVPPQKRQAPQHARLFVLRIQKKKAPCN